VGKEKTTLDKAPALAALQHCWPDVLASAQMCSRAIWDDRRDTALSESLCRAVSWCAPARTTGC